MPIESHAPVCFIFRKQLEKTSACDSWLLASMTWVNVFTLLIMYSKYWGASQHSLAAITKYYKSAIMV